MISLSDIIGGFGRGLLAVGTGGISEMARAAQEKQLQNTQQLGNIIGGGQIPQFAFNEQTPEQINQAKILQLANLGTPEAVNAIGQMVDTPEKILERKLKEQQIANERSQIATRGAELGLKNQALKLDALDKGYEIGVNGQITMTPEKKAQLDLQQQMFNPMAGFDANGEMTPQGQKYMDNKNQTLINPNERAAATGLPTDLDSLLAQRNQSIKIMQYAGMQNNAPLVSAEKQKQEILDKQIETVKGQTQLDKVLGDIHGLYTELSSTGGMRSQSQGAMGSVLSSIRNSAAPEIPYFPDIIPAGQSFGKAFSTKEQGIRDKIQAKIPLISAAIMKATGMSSKQMDSNVELQQYLKALSSPKNDYETATSIVSDLSRYFGKGTVGAPKENPQAQQGAANIFKGASSAPTVNGWFAERVK